MRYTTGVGVCHGTDLALTGASPASDSHEIDDAPAIENKGYKHPLKFHDELVEDSTGRAFHRKTYVRQCRAHYLVSFADCYPSEALPAI